MVAYYCTVCDYYLPANQTVYSFPFWAFNAIIMRSHSVFSLAIYWGWGARVFVHNFLPRKV